MAVVFVQEFAITDRSTANYDYVKERLGEGPFEGLIVPHRGVRRREQRLPDRRVWETREHADRFNAGGIQPIIDEGPDSFPNPARSRREREATYELFDMVR